MHVKRVTSIKKKPLVDVHGAAALLQILWQANAPHGFHDTGDGRTVPLLVGTKT